MRLLPRSVVRLALVLAFAGLAACTSDSPSEPDSGPVGPITPPPVTQWSISVTANPSELEAGTAQSSAVTVQVRRADTGAPPPNLTQITLTTSLGAFGSPSGPQTITLQVTNGQAQTVLFPGEVEGTATVRAQLDQSQGFANVRIGARATFFIESIQPSIGNSQGGETVTINGGGFEEPVRVTFGSATVQVLQVRPNSIRIRTPSAAAAGADVGVGETEQVNVAVTINVNEADQATDSIPNGFTFTAGGGNPQQPLVFGLDPRSGPNEGGTTVAIIGQGFESPVQVLFGDATGTGFEGTEAIVQSVTPGRIIVTSPPASGFGQDNRNQFVDVLVRNINTGFSTVASGEFRYGIPLLIAAISPDRGPATGDTQVVIDGQGFDEPVTVMLGGVLQDVRNVSGTQIVFRTVGITPTSCPAGGLINAGTLRVTNLDTGDFVERNDLPFRYTVPRPQIFGANPPGPGSVGSTTVISGEGFATNVQVLFGGQSNGSAAQITARSPTSITVRVPTPPPGFDFRTEPCDANGDGVANGERDTATPISITVVNLDSAGCVVTLSNAFTLNPTSTVCTGEDPAPPPPTQCTDGFDNDADGFIDAADPQCTGPTDNSESS